jgi:phage tail sheath gpL-like
MNFKQILKSLVPRLAIEQQFNASPGGSTTGKRDIWIFGCRVAAGTSTANEIRTVPFADADEAVAWYGESSEGAFMARQVFRGGKLQSRVYGVALTEPAGVAATQIIAFETDATSNGTFTFNVGGAVFSFSVTSGDGESDIGDACVAAWNALNNDVHPPYSAASAAGGVGTEYEVTWTAWTKGAGFNAAPVYQIITGQEPSGTTVTVNDVIFGADGGGLGAVAGTLYPTLTTVLSNLTQVETPIIVHGFDETPDGSTKNLDLIRAHLETKGNGENMLRGSQVCCLTKALATCVSDRAALDTDDAERSRLICQAVDTSTNSPGNMALAMGCWTANVIASKTDLAFPFNNTVLPYAIQHPDASDVLTQTEMDTLLEAACTPVNYNSIKGKMVLIKGVSARLFNAKPQPWAIVDVSDELRYQYLVGLAAAFPEGFKLAEDGETNADDMTTTPSGVLDVLHDVYFGEPMKGLIRNREVLWTQAVAEVNATQDGRVDWNIPHAVMMGLDVIAGISRQLGGLFGNEEA